MVVAVATSAFFAASPLDSSIKGTKPGTYLTTLGLRASKCSGSLKMQANAAPPKINGTSVSISTPGRLKTREDTPPSPPPRTFINQLPDWSMLLAAITTAFLAAEKQWMMIDWKPKRADMLTDTLSLGRIVQDGLIFRQNFSIRSYEIGADRTASIETVMNHLQETALNHVIGAGLLDSGFGSTPEMYKRKLIWVVTKMQVIVNRYPTWGETVQVDTWVCGSGKNSTRRGWIVSNSQTGEVLTRASSVWVMMNKQTRKLSKIPEEVRNEIEPYFLNSAPVVDEDTRKLLKVDDTTADIIRNGLTPRWNDLDVNQHVNNIKYIAWIVESTPKSMLETHELSSLTVEYRRECGKDSVLQSLTAVHPLDSHKVECEHLLRLENGAEILRARTQWRPKITTGKNSNTKEGGFPVNNV